MSSFRNQQPVQADAARVLLYNNYVMYDRWMSYIRFNSYYQDKVSPWNSDDDERQYYNKNLLNFLVLKFRRSEDGSVGEYNVVLFDTNFQNIYILGDYVHVCETDVNDDFNNDYLERTIRVTRIVACRPPEINCLGIVEGKWCNNTHSNDNGYCNKHQNQSREFEDIDLDRLLTLGELLNLPEFSSLRDLNFYKDSEECDNRRFHTFDSDTEFSDSDDYEYDDDDYDDRKHGPEDTIEDDDNNEVDNAEEKKDEERLTERELYWKEQQEIAELQEQEIMEDDLRYREYAREQMEKLEKESKEEAGKER